jgi:hypothetical protein
MCTASSRAVSLTAKDSIPGKNRTQMAAKRRAEVHSSVDHAIKPGKQSFT